MKVLAGLLDKEKMNRICVWCLSEEMEEKKDGMVRKNPILVNRLYACAPCANYRLALFFIFCSCSFISSKESMTACAPR